MQSVGWLVFCLGFAPTFAYLLPAQLGGPYNAVPILGFPYNYTFLVFLGVVCYVLSTRPQNRCSVQSTLIFVFIFFALIALAGLLFSSMSIPSLMQGIFGPMHLLAYGLLVVGVVEVVLLMKTFKISDTRAKYDYVWKWLRVSFPLFAVLFFIITVWSPIWGYDLGAWGGLFAMGVTNVLCGIVTTPTNRARFCVWLSSLGRNENDKRSAEEEARLIWVEFDTLSQIGGSSNAPEQMQVGVVHDKTSD